MMSKSYDQLVIELREAEETAETLRRLHKQRYINWEREVQAEKKRAGVAEAKVEELEALIAEHEEGTSEHDGLYGCIHCRGTQANESPHTQGCPWGQAAANHHARMARMEVL